MCIAFLGIELDSASMVARLPADRKSELQDALLTIRERKKCTKRELLSVIGRLTFAHRVVPAGRIFMRRMIDLSCTVKRSNHCTKTIYDTHNKLLSVYPLILV